MLDAEFADGDFHSRASINIMVFCFEKAVAHQDVPPRFSCLMSVDNMGISSCHPPHIINFQTRISIDAIRI